MKPRRIVRGERVTAGLVLTRDVAGLPKGRILSDDDVRALESSSWSELEALELESADVHEDAAGRRLAAAVAGGARPTGGAGAGVARGAAQRRATPGAGREPVDGSAGSGPARPRARRGADGEARGSGLSGNTAVDRVSRRRAGAGRALVRHL